MMSESAAVWALHLLLLSHWTYDLICDLDSFLGAAVSLASSLPGHCDFESGLCGFSQDKRSDAADWERRRGPTPTSYTGPTGDHTTGLGEPPPPLDITSIFKSLFQLSERLHIHMENIKVTQQKLEEHGENQADPWRTWREVSRLMKKNEDHPADPWRT